jgi:hypothetical protein
MDNKMLNILRYLSFEINNDCNMRHLHTKCPINSPERYKFGSQDRPIDDGTIIDFWKWCRFIKEFRGIVFFHMYNEPTLVIDRAYRLMEIMKSYDRYQPFSLITNNHGEYHGFDMYKVTDYAGGAELDDRILTNSGEGKPYSDMPRSGICGRGKGWEIPIDYYGNWCLCCNDWRCEESIGNILNEQFESLYSKWDKKRKTIQWSNQKEYERMPRMCRSCFDKNPSLPRRGGI